MTPEPPSQPGPHVGVPVCYRHPGRETYVRCARCERPICPECMNEAPVGFQCPECVRTGAKSTPSPRTAFGGSRAGEQGRVTYILIAINVAVALLSTAFAGLSALTGGGGWLGGGFSKVHEWGAIVIGPLAFSDGTIVEGISGGEYWRLGSALFIHYGLVHLLLNMWALWILGRYLENVLGPLRFLALYFVSGFGGNVAVYWLSGRGTVTAGASAAIFGLFGAVFFINRRLRMDNSGLVALIALNVVLGFVIPGISVVGHLGGLVTGSLVGLGLAYAPRSRRDATQTAVIAGAVAVLVVLTMARTATLL